MIRLVQMLGDSCCAIVDWSRTILLAALAISAALAFAGYGAASLLLLFAGCSLVVGSAGLLFVLSRIRAAMVHEQADVIVYNVDDFIAVGDDVTNDTPAIRRAINAARLQAEDARTGEG